jgi:phosphinothricin acetyltransferase
MIRQARADDAGAIAAIWNHMIRDTAATFNAEEKPTGDVAALIATRQSTGRAFLVADEAGTVLGFATYDQFRGGVGYRHSMEHTVHLAPSAQGRGFGRALMLALEDHARTADVHVMMAGVSSENPGGRAFHEALGYRLSGTVPQVGRKFGRWMDLWLLHKILT